MRTFVFSAFYTNYYFLNNFLYILCFFYKWILTYQSFHDEILFEFLPLSLILKCEEINVGKHLEDAETIEQTYELIYVNTNMFNVTNNTVSRM